MVGLPEWYPAEALCQASDVSASLFTKAVTVYTFIGQAVFGICLDMIFYYLVVYWSGVRGYDEIITGLCLRPETVAIPLAGVISGLMMRRTDFIRGAMFIGWPLTTLSVGLIWFMDTQTPLGILLFINGLVGLGGGIICVSLEHDNVDVNQEGE